MEMERTDAVNEAASAESVPTVTSSTALPQTVQTLLQEQPRTLPTPTPVQRKTPILAWVLLATVLLLASYFRFTGLAWDQFTHLHPDERFLTMVAERMQPVEVPLDYLRTSRSSLNPYNLGFGSFVYGNFPMTVTRYVAEWANAFCGELGCEAYGRIVDFTGYEGVYLIGRFLSGFVDLITILFVFLIGTRLYKWQVGIFAAFLYTCAVQTIQQAHFFTTDNWTTCLTMIALYCAIRASERGLVRWQVGFGVFLGLAVASRINVAPLAVVSGVAALVWLNKHVKTWRELFTQRGFDYALRAATGVMVAGILSLLVFRVAMPYAFSDIEMAQQTIIEQRQLELGRLVMPEEVSTNSLGVIARAAFGFNPQWTANMEEIQRLQKPDAVFPPATQWTDRDQLIFPLTNMLFWGIGLAGGLVGLWGVAWAFARISRAKGDWQAHLIPLSWTLLYFLFMGTRWVMNNRYFLPIYGIFLILGAWAMLTWLAQSRRKWVPTLAMTATMLGAMLWANAYVQGVYRTTFTRVAATEWFYENIPSGATLLYTDNAGDAKELQLPVKNHLFQVDGTPLTTGFEMPTDGTVTGIRWNYLTDEQTSDAPTILDFTLEAATTTLDLVWEDSAEINLSSPRSATVVPIDNLAVQAGSNYILRARMSSGGVLIADSSRILNEHWDDPLPARIDRDPFGQYYNGTRDDISGFDGSAPVTHPDSFQKLDDLIRWLDNSDVVVLSSQRAVWSLPRLPLTHPLMIRYYESLFSGELGYELVGQFHADLQIGPLHISDVGGKVAWGERPEVGWPPPSDFFAAEEAFSVYDHPPVWIFERTDDFSVTRARMVLESADLANAQFMRPDQASQTPNALMLDASTFAEQQQGGTFADIFIPNSLLNRQPLLAAVVWYVAVILIGLLTFPLAFVIFRNLSSRGYVLARILGLLLVAYFGWITASLDILPNRASTYWIGLLLVVALSAYVLIRHGSKLASFLRENASFILQVELLGLLLFLIGIGIRLGNPDVWHVIWGGEKPMDLTYFTATLKSTTFPPYDPWYAGGMLNYYYFGFVFVGALTQMLGIVPTIAYNLIIPMLFSFTGLGAFSVAYDLVASRNQNTLTLKPPLLKASGQERNKSAVIAGLFAAALAVLLGNLAQVKTILQWYSEEFFYPGNWFFSASRAIATPEGVIQPITEFPYFTFLYGDLHAHMIALPLTMLALAWVVNLALTTRHASLPTFFIGALAIGVLYPTNSWDWPTYLVLALIGAFILNLRRFKTFNVQLVATTIWQIALLYALSYCLFLPFHNTFGAGFTEIGFWDEAKTGLGSYLLVYGLFLLLTLVLLAQLFRVWASELSVTVRETLEPYAPALVVGMVAVGLVTFGLVSLGYQVAAIALPIIALAGILALFGNLSQTNRLILALIASAYGLTLIVEFVVIEGTVGRMNTVFKFYMQVWMLLSVLGGIALAGVLQNWRNWGSTRRTAFSTMFGVLIVAALLYPLTATRAKWNIRNPNAPTTLDGMEFMLTESYEDTGRTISLAPDYAALHWMQENIAGSPVVAEAYSGNYYRSIGNRVAMYTGLPTIIGWQGHQAQQRAAVPDARLGQRSSDVALLYNSADFQTAEQILDRYDVSYIYVGELERAYYDQNGLNKFETMAQQGLLEIVYDENGVTIYRVVDRPIAAN